AKLFVDFKQPAHRRELDLFDVAGAVAAKLPIVSEREINRWRHRCLSSSPQIGTDLHGLEAFGIRNQTDLCLSVKICGEYNRSVLYYHRQCFTANRSSVSVAKIGGITIRIRKIT